MKQISFDPLDYELLNGANMLTAKKARDEVYRALRKKGVECKRWVLRDQLRKYESFGVPDGRVRDVYYINVYDDKGLDLSSISQILSL